MRARRAAVPLVLALLLAGCSDGEGGDGDLGALGGLVPAPLADELTVAGRCDDGVLWAADDTGSLAVTVDAGADGPPAEVVLPSEDVTVSILRGDDLPETICVGEPDPASRSAAVRGRVEVDRPTEECGPTTFRIVGLESDDGTTFPPIDVRADPVDCASG